MRIITHCNLDYRAPSDHAWIAAWYRDDERLPLVFTGGFEDVAIAKARAWLAAEDAKVEGQKAFRESLPQRMAERAANAKVRKAKKERAAG